MIWLQGLLPLLVSSKLGVLGIGFGVFSSSFSMLLQTLYWHIFKALRVLVTNVWRVSHGQGATLAAQGLKAAIRYSVRV